MIDLLLALLGRCPWCSSRETPVRDLIADVLPYRMYAGLKIGRWDYNSWVGDVGLRLHSRHTMETI